MGFDKEKFNSMIAESNGLFDVYHASAMKVERYEARWKERKRHRGIAYCPDVRPALSGLLVG